MSTNFLTSSSDIPAPRSKGGSVRTPLPQSHATPGLGSASSASRPAGARHRPAQKGRPRRQGPRPPNTQRMATACRMSSTARTQKESTRSSHASHNFLKKGGRSSRIGPRLVVLELLVHEAKARVDGNGLGTDDCQGTAVWHRRHTIHSLQIRLRECSIALLWRSTLSFPCRCWPCHERAYIGLKSSGAGMCWLLRA